MQSEISRAGRPVGHSAKSLCEVGLKAPSNIDEKTSDVGLLGGVGEQRVVLGAPCRRTSRLLGCFRSHLMGVPVGSRTPRGTPATHYPARLRTTPQASSACLITDTCRRAEFDGWGRRLFVHVCHLFMDQWMSFGDREPSDRALLAELWRVFPPQPSEPALPAVRRRGLFCQSRSSSEIHSRAVD